MNISISVLVNAPLVQVWSSWITPKDITQWNFASDGWCCPKAESDFIEGGKFCYRMEAKDGSMGFDFEGVFSSISLNERVRFVMGDNRKVDVEFHETSEGITVTETFETEDENSVEQQKQGWQAILNNFKNHVENKSA